MNSSSCSVSLLLQCCILHPSTSLRLSSLSYSFHRCRSAPALSARFSCQHAQGTQRRLGLKWHAEPAPNRVARDFVLRGHYGQCAPTRDRSRFEAEHMMETCCTLDVFIASERTWAKTAERTGQILGKHLLWSVQTFQGCSYDQTLAFCFCYAGSCLRPVALPLFLRIAT